VNEDIIKPPNGISNISEWCKREACWTRILVRIEDVERLLHQDFYDQLLSFELQAAEARSAKKTQKVDNGIEAQQQVLAISAREWECLHRILLEKRLLTPKEIGILKIAMQIPAKLPTEKQCAILLDVLGKGRAEGAIVDA